MTYAFSDVLKRWPGENGWFYVLLPNHSWQELHETRLAPKRGFGSITVIATVGVTTWQTSIFPDTEQARYILFIKKAVRTKEDITVDQFINVSVEVKV